MSANEISAGMTTRDGTYSEPEIHWLPRGIGFVYLSLGLIIWFHELLHVFEVGWAFIVNSKEGHLRELWSGIDAKILRFSGITQGARVTRVGVGIAGELAQLCPAPGNKAPKLLN